MLPKQSAAILALIVVLAGCAAPGPAPVESPKSEPTPPPVRPATRETTAVASLMDSARQDAAAGRLVNAAATLERALRIEPRNPRLWSELARVRLQQGEWAQAEQTALRSNSFAGNDSELRSDNARIIAAARERRR